MYDTGLFVVSWLAADPHPIPHTSLTDYRTVIVSLPIRIRDGHAAYIETLLSPSLGHFRLKITLPSLVNFVPICCNHQSAVSDCPAPSSTDQ